MGNKTEEIIICQMCKGQEKIKYPNRDARVCPACNGKGRVWKITEIYLEKIDELHPKRLRRKGM